MIRPAFTAVTSPPVKCHASYGPRRATLLGALLDLADRTHSAGDDHVITRWRCCGLRAFEADRDAATGTESSPGPPDSTALT